MEEDKKPEETQEEPTEEAPLNIVEEAKKLHSMILAEKEELKAENDRKEKIQAEGLLAGTGGGGVEPEPKKEMTPEEYKDSIMKGEIPE